MDITGKRILVTGGPSGIGLEIARQMLERGGRVMISGRRADRLHQAVTELSPFGDVDGVAADVATAAGRQQTLDAAIKGLGGLNLLVNRPTFPIPCRCHSTSHGISACSSHTPKRAMKNAIDNVEDIVAESQFFTLNQ